MKRSNICNKLEDLIQKAKHSDEGMDFLSSSVLKIEAPLGEMVPASGLKHTRQEEYEAFIGCDIPTEVDIHPPTDVRIVGRCKRIKSGKETSQEDQKNKKKEAKVKVACLCKTCNQIVFRDSLNCPSKKFKGKGVEIVQEVKGNGVP